MPGVGDAPAAEQDDPDAAGTEQPTAHALPAVAHAKRVAAQASTPPPNVPGPQVSQQIALATLREEEA
jgi:hypothetical protein